MSDTVLAVKDLILGYILQARNPVAAKDLAFVAKRQWLQLLGPSGAVSLRSFAPLLFYRKISRGEDLSHDQVISGQKGSAATNVEWFFKAMTYSPNFMKVFEKQQFANPLVVQKRSNLRDFYLTGKKSCYVEGRTVGEEGHPSTHFLAVKSSARGHCSML